MTAPHWFPTPTWVRWLLVPALVFVALATDRNYLADFWHHLARGRAIVTEGQLLNHDRFTFTVPGREFQDVNWLTQVIYYRLYELGGLELVQVANALALALTLALLVAFCRRVSGSLPAAVGVSAFTFFGLWQVLTVRPQTFSLLLFVLVYDLLDRARRRRLLLVVPPLLLALWANLHGAFPAGLMLLGCFLLAEAWDEAKKRWDGGGSLLSLARLPFTTLAPWVGCLAGSTLATLVNPYGWKIYQYVGLTSNTAAVRRIDEWVPPTLDLWIGWAWLVSLVGMAGLYLACWRLRGRRPTSREVVLTLVFLPLACGSVRMVAWWLLVLAPPAATMIALLRPTLRVQGEEERRPSLAAGLVFGAILLAVFLSLPALQRFNPLLLGRQGPRTEADLDAVHARLVAHAPAGRIFSRFEWGEYLSWAYAPGYKVFMDGRIEIYPDDVWADYAAVTTGRENWEEILNGYRVDALLLDAEYHARTGLLPRVEQSGGWQRVHQERGALLYLRRPGAAVAQAR